MGKQLSIHFNEDEFCCRCCGRLPKEGINPELINKLEELRVILGKPISILSGYRCPTHNRAVGGAKHSQHLIGNASDIKVDGIRVETLAKEAERVNFNGIGCYVRQKFVHLDVRSGRARWTGK